MTYTINGKEYTELDINKAITEIIISKWDMNSEYNQFMASGMRFKTLCYTRNPIETWPIIEKCWDELTSVACICTYTIEWHQLIRKHKCTKLIAACIFFIEMNSDD